MLGGKILNQLNLDLRVINGYRQESQRLRVPLTFMLITLWIFNVNWLGRKRAPSHSFINFIRVKVRGHGGLRFVSMTQAFFSAAWCWFLFETHETLDEAAEEANGEQRTLKFELTVVCRCYQTSVALLSGTKSRCFMAQNQSRCKSP